MNKLTLLEGGKAVPYELSRDELTIGRHPECDIFLNSDMVSRRHARVYTNGGQVFIEDLGSGNGTFINGQRVNQPTAIKNEDRVKIGPILFRFDSTQAMNKTAPIPLLSSVPDGTLLSIDFDFTPDDAEQPTIMDTVENSGTYIDFDSQPEEKLRGIIEISRALAGTVDLEVLLPKILDVLFEVFPNADRGCILLKDKQTAQMFPRAYKTRRGKDDEAVRLSKTILNKVLEEKAGILSADASSDSRFESSASISDLTIRSMMCVPMLDLQGNPQGVISIDTQNPLHRFKGEDLDLLNVVAAQAALSYENATLMVSYMEKKRQDREMDIARNVQHALLPKSFPEINGYEFYASYDSAQAVGGDYYDAIRLSPTKICLAFGDVAGKGVPASLVMSRISSVVESTMGFVEDVRKAIKRINNLMCSNAVEGRFVTFVLLVIDTKKNTLSLANAGHMPPLIKKPDGVLEELGESEVGIPIGVLEDFEYEVVTRKLEPGEVFVIYTDGVSEAMNANNELYGIERLKETILTSSAEPVSLAQTILKDVRTHANGRPQNDDITLMTFGRVQN
ncbi:Phosphoserine phosphatase RsbU [Polystyrenella longa]|uniref:Phosphoserine phosphatase RsbU n=1 Tax=Polystyrenella longa TaxID=2528007 RepID=A0A518CL88_9PLAN|nr:SpoIIE family protein phosphatase [Polystyrenella longa]QDU79993.1 Phosphoserine phosphatase RsbU [Polystyrenella longa]